MQASDEVKRSDPKNCYYYIRTDCVFIQPFCSLCGLFVTCWLCVGIIISTLNVRVQGPKPKKSLPFNHMVLVSASSTNLVIDACKKYIINVKTISHKIYETTFSGQNMHKLKSSAVVV